MLKSPESGFQVMYTIQTSPCFRYKNLKEFFVLITQRTLWIQCVSVFSTARIFEYLWVCGKTTVTLIRIKFSKKQFKHKNKLVNESVTLFAHHKTIRQICFAVICFHGLYFVLLQKLCNVHVLKSWYVGWKRCKPSMCMWRRSKKFAREGISVVQNESKQIFVFVSPFQSVLVLGIDFSSNLHLRKVMTCFWIFHGNSRRVTLWSYGSVVNLISSCFFRLEVVVLWCMSFACCGLRHMQIALQLPSHGIWQDKMHKL